jgi:hypothetical protein
LLALIPFIGLFFIISGLKSIQPSLKGKKVVGFTATAFVVSNFTAKYHNLELAIFP